MKSAIAIAIVTAFTFLGLLTVGLAVGNVLGVQKSALIMNEITASKIKVFTWWSNKNI
jgi:ABC-type enterochelin transport system permease subunit